MNITKMIQRNDDGSFYPAYLYDDMLTWKAKGLLSWILVTNFDDCESDFTIDILKNVSKDAHFSTKNGLNELIGNGYVIKKSNRVNGYFAGYQYIVSNIKQSR